MKEIERMVEGKKRKVKKEDEIWKVEWGEMKRQKDESK